MLSQAPRLHRVLRWQPREPTPEAPNPPPLAPSRHRRLGDVGPGEFFTCLTIAVTIAVAAGVLLALWVAARLLSIGLQQNAPFGG